MMASATQMPLRLNPQSVYRLNSFYFSQDELAKAVDDFCQQSDNSFLYLWGDVATGKTHLSLAIAEQTQQLGKKTAYLPLMELVQTAGPEVLDALEQLDLLCIDEIEAITGRADWQEAVFHCFNRLQESGCQLLVTAKSSPAALDIALADLKSRLATGLIYQLNTLDDVAKQQVLHTQASARGLDMPKEVAQYLLRHHSRDLPALMHCLHALDKASMAAKRRLTIPFVRQVIQYGQN